MKKNKGFTLVELLVSFAITSAICGIMMQSLFSIKERSEKTAAFTEISVAQSNIIKTIENDLNKDTLTSIVSCGTNCYTFSYETLDDKDLEINASTNTITYGDYTKVLPDAAVLGTSVTIDFDYIDTIATGNNSVLEIVIPITNKYNSNDNDIKIYYQYNNAEISLDILPNLDVSGASAPDLASNMIPVYYDTTCASGASNCWKKAKVANNDIDYQWYDYDTKMWANAVTVTTSSRPIYQEADLGTTVLESDILTYMVWIPRYKYYMNGIEESISIEFENSSTTKSLGNATNSSEYRTHPAFTFGTDELEGIWVGKFETTAGLDSTCYTSQSTLNCDKNTIEPKIKPDAYPWRYTRVSTFFTAIANMGKTSNIYGYISNEVDIHMMKNDEWGAVAYLAYSVYGFNEEIWINPNSSYKTGQAGSELNALPSSSTYNYNNYTFGVNASTTGNVYGIYDMSGGALEYVMGNYNKYSGYSITANSGFNGYNGYDGSITTDGIPFPEDKYSNLYTTTINTTACNGGICYGHALSETAGWNNDGTGFITVSYPWLTRGGLFSHDINAGVFASTNRYGSSYEYIGTRIVQIKS